MKITNLIISLILFSSCSIYRKTFDNCSSRGFTCKSVTEIENMIVETNRGEDLFVPYTNKNCSCHRERSFTGNFAKNPITKKELRENNYPHFINEQGDVILKKPETMKRLWVHGQTIKNGGYAEGKYVYFTIEDDQWIILHDELKD